ncbi:hypothetical protein DPMN_105330 [Dreissena polymorpha]|uniref:DOMON domain-containing protein n=1 Tax=Dreissena polymorpha TaxID=45954 RepID=A0A9D4K284_DREPO|nr:hypothetical protein DPMN_105330 [Dreissena polymorpha]
MDIVSVCAETGTACTGSGESYSHPSGRYFVSWQRDRENKNMLYTISGWLSDKERQWLALGFNYQNRMASSNFRVSGKKYESRSGKTGHNACA